MDTITHLAAGAVVGGLTGGEKAGKKALAWGAFFGYFPDVDVILGAFMTDMGALSFHRGITHSLLFTVIAPFLLALLPWYFHEKSPITYTRWTFIAFLALVSHVFLDIVTSYGTQIFMPFSNTLVYTANLSIIDPLFSLPLLIVAILGFISGISFRNRRWLMLGGIILSSLYLGWTFLNKSHVNEVFGDNFQQQDEEVQEFITQPSLFNNLLWRGIGSTEEGYYVGFYSLLDEDTEVDLTFIPRNASLLDEIPQTEGLNTLKWFGDGFYQIEAKGGQQWHYHNLRFGKTGAYGDERSGSYPFSYRITKAEDNLKIERVSLSFGDEEDRPSLKELWNRVMGE